ncbi:MULTISPECIES: catalase [unclassified Chitinophaga]|uniref:catalase n=1 Tax=unclassified Chitinophaga TaxID=2619133 RepID=UPI0009C893BA|nr:MULTISPECIES: catalase [unclassified Chitinophaga]OMP76464.1 catalase HPII [[Flexibacter] sp. ATCC 35208]WPV66221.1 catalase [Chitinophaga sp. LS1]
MTKKKPLAKNSPKDNTGQPASSETAKTIDLQPQTIDATDQTMNTNQGTLINDDMNTLKAGDRGPSLLEDFIFREKMTHFDHERIPERVVHARGVGAHGVFRVYESQADITKAGFLNDPSRETPVFVRFSTVAGSRGSSDLARDVRGFAVKFYTQEGNFDLVGNNIPVFFIQDAMKFPDLIHAAKPEADNEIPQAATAHDTFWDFISLMPESTHMVMWVMSDRAIPRSLRMMEGFGVHTFRLINEAGQSHFVKFHWKPILGVHAVAWNEALKISGMDPDFHRRDLWNAIESGNYPEWELGIQVIAEEDEHKFDFDILDPTKIIPEESVPVQKIGRLTLNRNPDNYFAETEQVAFHVGNIVPGIDFSDDPLMQGRLFSYTDTQLIRLGGPNFHEIPINRPIVPVYNNQRDGHMRQTINKGKANYSPNTVGGGCPYQAMMKNGGFSSFPERVDANKIRQRSKSFMDHFSQAKLFWYSQSDYEKNHIIDALSFELGKVQTKAIRERMLRTLVQVNDKLAAAVAFALGMPVPDEPVVNEGKPADGNPKHYASIIREPDVKFSAALSMAHTIKDSILTRQIAVLVADGVSATSLNTVKNKLMAAGAVVEIIAPRQGYIQTAEGDAIEVDKSFLTSASVLYDAVYVPGGVDNVIALQDEPDAIHFLNEAWRHCKAIAFDADAEPVLKVTYIKEKAAGLIIGDDAATLADEFIKAVQQHRFWERETARKVPA